MTNIKKLPNIYKLNDYTQYIIYKYTQDDLNSNELYSLIIHTYAFLFKSTHPVELKYAKDKE